MHMIIPHCLRIFDESTLPSVAGGGSQARRRTGSMRRTTPLSEQRRWSQMSKRSQTSLPHHQEPVLPLQPVAASYSRSLFHHPHHPRAQEPLRALVGHRAPCAAARHRHRRLPKTRQERLRRRLARRLRMALELQLCGAAVTYASDAHFCCAFKHRPVLVMCVSVVP